MTTATAIEISMPKLSDSMEEGTILSWLAKAGAAVTVGQDLLEVETDKANMTVQAAGSGVLEILVGEGGTVAVGTPIARLGDGAAAAPSAEPLPPAVPGKRLRSTPLARRAARDHGIALGSIEAGSGVGGRIVIADVLAAAGIETRPSAEPAPAAAAPSREVTGAGAATIVEGAKGGPRTVELSRLQVVIARRMAADRPGGGARAPLSSESERLL
jgi:pyruvate dehydrogenase E2 component (dihydrolipoamide acetyltransferase)